jgi:multidrug resistance efflux pump
MLAVASVLPDDRERLRLLIPSGINPHDFTEEVKNAIEKRKKKEAEKKLSADEKASLLEEELAAELAELENALEKKDDGEIEEKILKEIEDLENL